MEEDKQRLIEAIEKAIGEHKGEIEYIICDDMLEFEKYENQLVNNKYVIQQFGDYYVALIF